MIDFSKPIHISGEYYILFKVDGRKYAVNHEIDPKCFAEVESYLLDHPEALVPEPVPPPPTEEDLAARRIAEIKAQLASLDQRAMRPLRAMVAGTSTQADKDALGTIEKEVCELRSKL